MATIAHIRTDWYAGTHFSITFAFTEDIAGWILSWMLKRSVGVADADAAVIKTTGSPSGVTIIGTFDPDPALNTQRAVVEIEPEDTATLATGTYRHELKRIDPDDQFVLVQGSAVLKPAVHQSVA